MNEQNNKHEPEDVVDRAMAALRGSPVPAGPSEALLKRTIARAGAGEITKVQDERNWWNMRAVRRSALAAGLLLILGTGLMLLFRGAGVAFADVVQQVNTAHAVRCKMMVEIDVAGGKQTSEVEALMVAPGWTIVKSPGLKMITSMQDSRMVTLTEATKVALVMDLKNRPATPQVLNLLDTFKNVDGKAGKPLGEREIDGKKTRGFAVSNGGMDMKVWADVKTEFPVLVEMTPNSTIMPAGTYTMKDFEWNPTYDPHELSVEVPEGYHTTTTAMDASIPTEQDVTGMLKAMAEYNDGMFPESVGLEGFSKMLATRMVASEMAETAGMTAEQKAAWRQKASSEMMAIAAPVSRGWAFMNDTAKNANWQYGGNGAKLGEKGRGILWYQAQPSGQWRMIEGDLTIHDTKEAELPKGEPVKPLPGAATAPAATAPAK